MNDDNKPCCGARAPAKPAEPAAGAAFARVSSGSTEGMVLLEGGAFLMGNDDESAWPGDGEGPVREVFLDPFWIDATAVSNAQFARFVEATGYVTDAERFGWSYVFDLLAPPRIKRKLQEEGRVRGLDWWLGVPGASWRKPEGPGSNVNKRLDHPVVHASWNDAAAYCAWAGARLPTEAEWEYAARGGLVGARYPWGDELEPGGKHRCNIWQGEFPKRNTAADGYVGAAPVRSYRANGYGLYNMSGNVWEWCHDWFDPAWHVPASDATRRNPAGAPAGQARVMKGGSYLCHASYCNRYRVAAKTANTPDTSSGHVGFRCARDV